MTNQNKLSQKRKARSKVAKAKVLARREKVRKERKMIDLEKEIEIRTEELAYGKSSPIVERPNSILNMNRVKENKDKTAMDKLENNMRILEALEQEYMQEQESRLALNSSLEDKGCVSISDKMKVLQDVSLQQN